MKYFITLVLLLFAVNVSAAKLTWTIESTSGTVSKSGPTISDVNMTRFVDWLWYAYPQIDNTDPDSPVAKPRTPANEAQAFRDWATSSWNGTKANVIRWEENEAAQTARDGVGDLE